MHLTGLDLFFWAASFIEHVVLLSILLMRRRAQTFPIFTALIGLDVVRTIALFFIQRYGAHSSYFYTYWTLGVVDVALQLGVVYEITSSVFRPRRDWAADIRRRLVLWLCASIAVAAGLTWIPTPPTQLWIQVVMIKSNFFTAALLSELFVGMIVLSAMFGRPWRTHIARIALGLGVYSAVTVIVESARTFFGLQRNARAYGELSHIRIVVYLACAAYWIIMMWRDAPPPRELSQTMREQLRDLQASASLDLQTLRSRRQS
jgi:hypothetical protein